MKNDTSFAMEILNEYKTANKNTQAVNIRLIWIIVLLIITNIVSICYLVNTLNDIGTIDESITQQNDGGDNNYIGNDGDINGNPNN